MKKILGLIICTLLVLTTALSVVGVDENKEYTSHNLNHEDPLNQTDEWPMYHHDAQNSGYSSSYAPNTGNIHWTYKTTDSVYYSSPAVASGQVFIGCEAGYLYCIDVYNGSLIWDYSTGDSYMKDSSPAVYDGNVYFTQQSNNVIICLDANTGSLVWEKPVEGRPAKSLTIANGRIYFGANTDKIYCWVAANGNFIWEYTTGGNVNSIPAVNNNQVYVGSVDGYMYCLNADNGTEIWSFDTGNVVNSGPSVANGFVYFGSYSNYIYCLAEDTGTLVWSYNADDRVSSSPAIAYDKIYVTSSITLYCFNSTSGDFIWSYTPNIGIPASPAVADGKVYIGDCDYYFFCFNANTGNIIWQKNLDWHFIVSSPAIYDGMVIVGQSNNSVFCFRDPNLPPYPPEKPTGPSEGLTNVEYSFDTSTTDPEGGDVCYLFDWGDGTQSSWIGPFPSGQEVSKGHSWNDTGDFEVKVKAKDVEEDESNWSPEHTITIIEGPILKIGKISGGLFRVKAEIDNIGGLATTDVNWSITLKGGAFSGKKTEGSDLNIIAGGSETVTSNLILGLGPIVITVEAWLPESSDIKEQSGFVLLFYVKVNPGG